MFGGLGFSGAESNHVVLETLWRLEFCHVRPTLLSNCFFFFLVSAEIRLSEETSEQKQHLETSRLVGSVAGLTESF